MNVSIRTLPSRFFRNNIRKYNTNNIWNIKNIDLLHDDFDKIQQLKNDSFHLPFIISEIPPPFCPKCNKYAKNKCLFSPIHDISIDDFDLAEIPNLTIQCPVFGEFSTIFDKKED